MLVGYVMYTYVVVALSTVVVRSVDKDGSRCSGSSDGGVNTPYRWWWWNHIDRWHGGGVHIVGVGRLWYRNKI